jgi:hypothetical protein
MLHIQNYSPLAPQAEIALNPNVVVMVSYLLALVGSWLIYVLVIAVYNLHIHPLSRVPGPRLWIVFPILRQIAGVRGLLDIRMKEFHDYYGDVVR